MQMVDVNDDNLKAVPQQQKQSSSISDEEIIRKSMEAVAKGLPVQQSTDQSNYWDVSLSDLPSRGRLYPEGTKIMFRPLKVLEVKKLSSLTEANSEFVITDILKKTVKGIAIDNILVADKVFLIMLIRANSFRDPSYIVDFHCSKCDKDSQFHFEIGNIGVQYLADDYDPTKILTMPNGDQITFKFLTIGDIAAIQRHKDINKNAIGELDEELLSIAGMITTINGEKLSLQTKYDYVLNADPGIVSYLMSYIDKYGMGLKPSLTVKCEKCEASSETGLSFRPDFFFPSYKLD